ncbi:hypothetical protein N780_01865 [Pontibacillus chungwhensis BH030062]|uniref:CPBP family intramembrane metalloprotease n=1 Tax=Pontibacillus chungwhensis BH030062 TaxID=1385513 RepID=A0A0A2UWW7_9BACI|nr:hypothetical protein [Pontibacillus chungwhensis]KGP92394.1 hypothetical protein N780_01865 [Pontibacillus chungwhensis BH030062]
MKSEKKSLYFYMSVGYLGLLLVGLAAMRFIAVFHDSTGQAYALFGFLLVVIYIRFVEKKLGISNKEFILGKVILIVVFSILTFWLYF